MIKHKKTKYQYKMIFSDIDGTLLDSNHIIPQTTKAMILKLEQEGVPLVFVSARMPDGIDTVREQLGNHAPTICYSGGLIYDEDGEVVYSTTIELEKAVRIKAVIDTKFPELCCNTYGYHTWLVDDDCNPWVLQEEKITGLKASVGNLCDAFEKEKGIHKFLLMGEPDAIRKAEEQLKQQYPELSISASKDTYLEITHGQVKKSAAVSFLCSSCGYSIEEVVACGDGENDIDMLEAVPESYAMGNASESVKQRAAHVTSDNDHEGLLQVLQTLFRGQESVFPFSGKCDRIGTDI